MSASDNGASEHATTVREDLRLVSDETWQRVRARDTPAPYGSHNARPKHPLSGLLLCAECGRAMTLCGGKNSQGYGSHRYICPSHREHGNVGCTNDMGVSRLVAEELLIEPFRERLLSDQNFLTAVSTLKKGRPENGVEVFEVNGAGFNRDSGKGSNEASILANAERLRAALVSAATDALRDALRRTLGTVRCMPTQDGETRYLHAQFEGGDYPLLEWLATGDAANQPDLSALVAGA